jgi:4-hydroxy-tetrahydrodipicolinate reductase
MGDKMIRLAQLYTGGVGSEIVRRLAGHRELELVAVLVHSEEKEGLDSGTLVGAAPNGIVTTRNVDDVLAARPDAAIYSGMLWDVDLIARLLRAGVNVYTGMGGYYLPGQPEFETLDAAGREGNASLAAGGNIPGLISDVFPLFVSGYTGRIREIRVWQRNHVSTYPSGTQIQTGLGIGLPPTAESDQSAVDAGWVWAMRQSANLVAAGLGIECTDLVLADKRIALAPEDTVLPGSGLLVAKGTVAGAQWKFVASSGGREFLTITNEQTAVLGLGPGWRANHDEPPWRVEIDGEPPIVATFGWPDGVEPGAANSLLNAARAMNIVPRLVAAPPGCVSVLDFPAVTAGDGLAPA